MVERYISKMANVTERPIPVPRLATKALTDKAKLLLRNGEIAKGNKIVTAEVDRDSNAVLTPRGLWRALPVTMAQARLVLQKLIDDGDVVSESERYAALHDSVAEMIR